MSINESTENLSDFDYVYLEAVLTRGVLTEADLILILKEFGIGSFEEYTGDKDAIRDMSYVLINEAPPKKLLNEVLRVTNEDYSDRLNFDEAQKIYDLLKNLSLKELIDFYHINLYLEEPKKSVDADDMGTLILGELLKLPKEEAFLLARSKF